MGEHEDGQGVLIRYFWRGEPWLDITEAQKDELKANMRIPPKPLFTAEIALALIKGVK